MLNFRVLEWLKSLKQYFKANNQLDNHALFPQGYIWLFAYTS